MPASAPLSFTVLTVNTHKGFTPFNRRFILPELREAVRSVHADLVFLQEVHGTHAGHATRHNLWPAVPQYEFLADQIWSDFAYGRNAVYPEGDHGNALLSKFPIQRWVNHDVSGADFAGEERRGLLHCVLTVPGSGREVHAVCVHLGLREAQRAAQLQLLCELIDRDVPPDAPLIVAGDFNDWRLRAHHRLQQCARLIDSFASAGQPAPRTFPARWPVLRLDRIYARNVQVQGARVLSTRPWSHLSDHAPLCAEIRL
ncbi:endonuclease/exonuclease/phosphatase family protein [uncultured Aquabacterium sp.]|uniref:endonuclease/exonuclease/phosphatase family protein n=1 Tax=Aquabacterium sp. TaxID=1872578 RepID=UPI0025F42AF4|nr:endonuclease/exonuclease/phosphatase family protein [uncultured Aquabacterium sp.]